MTVQFHTFLGSLAAVAALLVASVADAGVVRNPGDNSVAAPALTGFTHLVSDATELGDPLPPAAPDHIFGNGHSPYLSVYHAGETLCIIESFTCWGE